MRQGKKQNKKEKKSENGTVIHASFPIDLDLWIRQTADSEQRTVRNMLIVLVGEARRARERQP